MAHSLPPFHPTFIGTAASLVALNATTNQSSTVDYAFSIIHNSTISSPVVQGYVYDQYDYYWLERKLVVSGVNGQPLVCSESPLAGSPGFPPVQFFQYNGTVTVGDQTCWLWRLQSLAYATQRTPQQYPVVLIDGLAGTFTFFTNFESFAPPAQWPPAYWMVPDPCPTSE